MPDWEARALACRSPTIAASGVPGSAGTTTKAAPARLQYVATPGNAPVAYWIDSGWLRTRASSPCSCISREARCRSRNPGTASALLRGQVVVGHVGGRTLDIAGHAGAVGTLNDLLEHDGIGPLVEQLLLQVEIVLLTRILVGLARRLGDGRRHVLVLPGAAPGQRMARGVVGVVGVGDEAIGVGVRV